MKQVIQNEWENWIKAFPNAHLLQSTSWGKLKNKFGWSPTYFSGNHCGALLLLKSLPLGFKIGYIPKGPIGYHWEELWPVIEHYCKSNQVIFLKIEPDLWHPNVSEEVRELCQFTEKKSETIQPRRTIILSLQGEEADWLLRMNQKTRYNIRLAKKKGVRVDISSDIVNFSKLMQITGDRDQFGVHTEEYYQEAYKLFKQNGECELLMAYFNETLLAGLMIFKRGSRAWYLFGGSNNNERNRMPNYLIQWEAMRWAGSKGCLEYDLWGAPDEDMEVLEANFKNRGDGLWGVYRFKRGFGGELKRSVGAWDKIFYPNLYKGYQWLSKLRKSAS